MILAAQFGAGQPAEGVGRISLGAYRQSVIRGAFLLVVVALGSRDLPGLRSSPQS